MSERSRVCASCGEKVTGDKYICLHDPEKPENILYFCSKGKCNPRKMAVPKIRKIWLDARRTQ